MIVVSDTSPLHYLILINRVDLLPKLFGQVITTQFVIEEMSQPSSPEKVRRWVSQLPTWLELKEPSSYLPEVARLDRGEASAISLASELGAGILIDERDGAKVAEAAGLEVIGILGLLLNADRKGLGSLREALAELRQTNFRYTEKLFDGLIRQSESES